MDTTSGANRLRTLSNQCFRRLVGVGANAHGVATTPLLRELGIAPIKATAAADGTRASLKAPTLSACISDLVGQPSRMHQSTATSWIAHGPDRVARESAELAQGVRVPHVGRSLHPRIASNLVAVAVWDRFETSYSACTNTWSIYSHASYARSVLPQYDTYGNFGRGRSMDTQYDSIS
jgi:hypothetical protein